MNDDGMCNPKQQQPGVNQKWCRLYVRWYNWREITYFHSQFFSCGISFAMAFLFFSLRLQHFANFFPFFSFLHSSWGLNVCVPNGWLHKTQSNEQRLITLRLKCILSLSSQNKSQLSDPQSKSFKFHSHIDKASTHAFRIYQLHRQFTTHVSQEESECKKS